MEDDARSRPLAGAGALLLDDEGHVLIVEPVYKAKWEIPGGAVDQGETPHAACARELMEELGLDLSPGRLLVVDWATGPVGEERVRFVFDGGVLAADQFDAIVLPPEELESWACMPAEELFVMLEPDLTRRITAALAAREAGETWYLEDGVRINP